MCTVVNIWSEPGGSLGCFKPSELSNSSLSSRIVSCDERETEDDVDKAGVESGVLSSLLARASASETAERYEDAELYDFFADID